MTPRQGQSRRRWRRVALALVPAMGYAAAGIATATVPATAQSQGFVNGAGTAYSQVLALRPGAGNIAFAITSGFASAHYDNSTAFAEGAPLNLGLLGTALTLGICGGDPPMSSEQLNELAPAAHADTNDNSSHTASADFASQSPQASHSDAAAEPNAHAVATSTAGSVLDIPKLLTITPGTAHSETTLVSGQERSAHATVDFGSIKLLDLDGDGLLPPVVQLDGLHWEATQVTDGPPGAAPKQAEGRFTIGNVRVAGSPPLKVDSPEALQTALGLINNALKPWLMTVDLPTVQPLDTATGRVAVTPLRLTLKAGPATTAIVNPWLDVVQQSDLWKLLPDLLTVDCKPGYTGTQFDALRNVTWNYVIDLVLVQALLRGSGAVPIELGGVEASTVAKTYKSAFGTGTPPPALPPSVASGSGTRGTTASPISPTPGSSTSGTSASTGYGAAPAPEVVPTGDRKCVTTHPKNWPGCAAGSAPLAVVLAGVTGAALLAGDVARSRRRTRRTYQPEGATP